MKDYLALGRRPKTEAWLLLAAISLQHGQARKRRRTHRLVSVSLREREERVGW